LYTSFSFAAGLAFAVAADRLSLDAVRFFSHCTGCFGAAVVFAGAGLGVVVGTVGLAGAGLDVTGLGAVVAGLAAAVAAVGLDAAGFGVVAAAAGLTVTGLEAVVAGLAAGLGAVVTGFEAGLGAAVAAAGLVVVGFGVVAAAAGFAAALVVAAAGFAAAAAGWAAVAAGSVVNGVPPEDVTVLLACCVGCTTEGLDALPGVFCGGGNFGGAFFNAGGLDGVLPDGCVGCTIDGFDGVAGVLPAEVMGCTFDGLLPVVCTASTDGSGRGCRFGVAGGAVINVPSARCGRLPTTGAACPEGGNSPHPATAAIRARGRIFFFIIRHQLRSPALPGQPRTGFRRIFQPIFQPYFSQP
jgi:hypothetical protein